MFVCNGQIVVRKLQSTNGSIQYREANEWGPFSNFAFITILIIKEKISFQSDKTEGKGRKLSDAHPLCTLHQ